jgi:hypothetical protein
MPKKGAIREFWFQQLEQTRTGEFDDNSINNQIVKFGHRDEHTAPLTTMRVLFKRARM